MRNFERRLLLPYARFLFNLYGALGFLAIFGGVATGLYGFSTQELMSRTQWLESNNKKAVNTRDVVENMSDYYNTEKEEKEIESITGYMFNNPAYTKEPVEKTEFGPCLSKSTYQNYKMIDNPEKRNENTFPWSVWKTTEFVTVLERNNIDPGNKVFVNNICSKVSNSSMVKPKFVKTNTVSGYSPWMDLGYRVKAIAYAEARYDDYSSNLMSENLQKLASRWIGLWLIVGGSSAVAIAALIISFMGIESNLRELERNSIQKIDQE